MYSGYSGSGHEVEENKDLKGGGFGQDSIYNYLYSPVPSTSTSRRQTEGMAFEDLISTDACGPASGPASPIGHEPYFDFSSTSYMGLGDPMHLDTSYPMIMDPIASKPTFASTHSSAAPSPDAEDQLKDSSSESAVSTRSDSATPTDMKLLLLGIPEEGTKTRVETQLKITLMLVQRDPQTMQLGRVDTWKYIKLPAFSALKRKNKRHFKTGVVPEETLFMEVHVVKSSNPAEEVFICANCQERERKRAQRKKESRVKPAPDMDSDSDVAKDASIDNDERRIILFNCGDYIDFAGGEISVPVRVACYCRHHKEKDGFLITMLLRDHTGREVAHTVSPKILTTDDHKARPRVGRTGESNSNISRNTSLESLASLASSAESAASLATTSTTKRSPRLKSNSSFSLTSISDALQNENGPGKAPATKTARTDNKPYDSGRPSKRSSIRSSAFSMTPLNSPPRAASPELSTAPVPVLPTRQDFIDAGFSDTSISPSMLLPPQPSPFVLNSSLESSSGSAHASVESLPSLADNSYMQSMWSPPLASIGSPAAPVIDRIIPNEGPIAGGTEVTILGKNFTTDFIVLFGRTMATTTTLHSSSTLICVSPAAVAGGTVTVTFRNRMTNSIVNMADNPTRFFTYVDMSDRNLMELALQIVGMRSSGRVEGATEVAKRIIGSASATYNSKPTYSGTVGSQMLADSLSEMCLRSWRGILRKLEDSSAIRQIC